MKFGICSVLGLVSASMLGACGPSKTVGGKAVVTTTQTAPLKLDVTSTVLPELRNPEDTTQITQAERVVKYSEIYGYYHTCLGKQDFEPFHLALGVGDFSIKVAQDDYECKLRATGIRRDVAERDGANMVTELYDFVPITTNQTNGTVSADTDFLGQREAGQQYDGVDIEVRDGYFPGNLRMAVNQNGIEMGLVNIAGTNTGIRSLAGQGGFSADFEVTVLTGSVSDRLDSKTSVSEVFYSHNVGANTKELPAPTYNLDASSVHIAVNPRGYITPSSYGSFRFIVGARNFVTQAGTEYIYPSPTDGTTCTSETTNSCTNNPVRTAELTEFNPTLIPSEEDYRMLSEARQYAILFNRWQELKGMGSRERSISASDKSIALPVLTLYPLGDGQLGARGKLFDVTHENTVMEPLHASQLVIIRNRASGAVGSEYDANSGVISYQAFQIKVQAPVDFLDN